MELIKCACGCGQLRPKYDKRGRTMRFIFNHDKKESNKGKNNPMYGIRSPNWKGGLTKTSDGHIYEYCPSHPYTSKRGYVMQHRLVMEKYLGRYLKPEEIVHHINGIKTDNRIENLELFESVGKHIVKYHINKRDKLGRFSK